MPLAVITVNNLSPALEKRFQETQVISRAVALADTAIRSAGGQSASGNIIDAGVLLGSWTYTAQASS